MTDVRAPSWATSTSITTDGTGAIHIRGSDGSNLIKNQAVSTTLGSFKVNGNSSGSTTISCILEEAYRQDGTLYPQTSQEIQVKIIPSVTFPAKFGDLNHQPQDTNNDGLYEDLNGNNRLDLDDIILFFKNLDFIKASELFWAFDYDGNNQLNFNDVVSLFKKYNQI